jgi:hypothetical protein
MYWPRHYCPWLLKCTGPDCIVHDCWNILAQTLLSMTVEMYWPRQYCPWLLKCTGPDITVHDCWNVLAQTLLSMTVEMSWPRHYCPWLLKCTGPDITVHDCWNVLAQTLLSLFPTKISYVLKFRYSHTSEDLLNRRNCQFQQNLCSKVFARQSAEDAVQGAQDAT